MVQAKTFLAKPSQAVDTSSWDLLILLTSLVAQTLERALILEVETYKNLVISKERLT